MALAEGGRAWMQHKRTASWTQSMGPSCVCRQRARGRSMNRPF